MARSGLKGIVVGVEARTGGFKAEMRSASRSMVMFGQKAANSNRKAETSFVQVRKAATRATAAIAAFAGVGGLGALVGSSFRAIDALDKTSQRLGIASDRLAGLRLAAEETAGVASNTLDMALQRMVRRVGEAAHGTGEAQGALKELGLEAKALAGLTPDQQFARIADAMSKAENQSDRVRLAFKLFDSEGVALVNTLKEGSAGLEKFQEDAVKLGLAVGAVDARLVAAANDQLARAKALMQGVANVVAVKLAPVIAVLTERFVKSTGGVQGLSDKLDNLGGPIARVAGWALELDRQWRIVVATMNLGASQLGTAFARADVAISNTILGLINGALKWLTDKMAAVTGAAADMARSLAGLPGMFGGEVALKAAEGLDRVAESMRRIGEPFDGETPGERHLQHMIAQTEILEQRLEDLKNSPTGQEIVDQIVAQIQELRTATQDAMAEGMIGGAIGAGLIPDEEKMEKDLERLREFLMTAEEIELEAFERRMEMINNANIGDIERNALREKLEAKHQDALVSLAQKGQATQLSVDKLTAESKQKIALSAGKQLLGGLEAFGKAGFKIQKVFAIADSILAIQAGIAKAMNNPWPLNLVAAAQVAAQGLSIITNIRSLTDSGSGSVTDGGSAGSPGAAAAEQAVQARGAGEAGGASQQVVIRLEGGGVFPEETVRSLVEQINEAVDNNVELRVA